VGLVDLFQDNQKWTRFALRRAGLAQSHGFDNVRLNVEFTAAQICKQFGVRLTISRIEPRDNKTLFTPFFID
jgi:hypothetical protein